MDNIKRLNLRGITTKLGLHGCYAPTHPQFAFSCAGIETHPIYARIATEAIADINITSTIDSMAFMVFIGISNASAIMIGNRIGAGEEERAIKYARRALILGIPLALVMGARVLLFSGTVLAYYKVSETVAIVHVAF